MKLQKRLAILFSLLALIPLLLVSYLGYLTQREALLRQTTQQLISVADIQELRINEKLHQYIERVKLITSRTQLRLSLADYNDTGEAESLDRIRQIIVDARDSISEIEHISVLDLEGEVIASTNPEQIGLRKGGEEFFYVGQHTNYLHTIFRDERNILQALLTGPFLLDGEVIGVVEVISSPAPLFAVTEDYSGLGDTGEVILAKQNAYGDAVFLTPLRFDAGAALNRAIPAAREHSPLISAIQGKELVLISEDTVDYRGEQVFAVTRFIDALGWGLAVKIDRAEAFAPVEQLAKSYIAIVLLSSFLIVLLSVLTIRSVVHPIRLLTLFAQNLQSGNFSMRTEVRGSGEVGLLARAFNSMAEKLQGLYRGLEKEVADRTRDLAKFQLAVEDASDHIIITDPKGIILYANPAVEGITGYTRKEVIGKKAGSKQLWGGLMDESFYTEMWKRLKKDKRPFVGEMKNKRKNGEEYYTASSISPILDDSGNVEFFVGIERDITKEKQIDQAKTEFVSLASHQLRTPLSSINWYAEMLIAGDAGKLTETQKEYLEEIYTGNQRMVGLVNALLNVSRLELGTFMVEPEDTDLIDLVKGVVKELQPMIVEKNMHIHEGYGELPIMKVDPKLMRIVFQNLLSNAVKYTSDNGQVHVHLSVVKRGDEKGGRKMRRKSVFFEVRDTGMGIPITEQDKVFSKLFRADNVRASDTEGTGLGLYIVKSIVEHSSGGEIWFQSPLEVVQKDGASDVGSGTAFYAIIPIQGMVRREGTKALS